MSGARAAADDETTVARPLLIVAERALRDRLKLPLYGGAGLAILSVFGIGAFSGLDSDALFRHLPVAFENVIGGDTGGNVVVSEVFGLIAPIVVLVVAISGGVEAVAGEERDGTADLLLAQPILRRDLVLAKAGALVVHLLLAVTVFVVGFLIGSTLFHSGIAPDDAFASGVHLLVFGLAFAMIALALSSWTGSVPISFAVASGLAVVADLMASTLPLVNGLGGGVKASPWYYYDGSRPLVNGLDPLHLAVLSAVAGAMFVLALIGVQRRDVDWGVHKRALSIPALESFTRPRVRSIFIKSVTERAGIVVVAGSSLAIMAVAVALMFDGLQGALSDLSENIPPSVAGLYGAVDLGTPDGWINGEMLSVYVPVVIISVAVMLGAEAIAGEEQRHTLALLLAAPVTRRRVVAEKAAALVVVVVTISVISGLGILAGSALAGLGLTAVNVVAALTHATLLALFFGFLALSVGAARSSHTATRVSAVGALAAYVVQAFLSRAQDLEGVAMLSPWHYYNSSNPLAHGFDPMHLGVLAALTAVGFAAALILVDRREVSS